MMDTIASTWWCWSGPAGCRPIKIEWLPPCAPELKPVEYLRTNFKHHRLPNHGLFDVVDLQTQAWHEAERIAPKQSLPRSFVHAAALPVRFK